MRRWWALRGLLRAALIRSALTSLTWLAVAALTWLAVTVVIRCGMIRCTIWWMIPWTASP